MFRAQIKNGILEVPDFESPDVLKPMSGEDDNA
jgi:hypothetical protein